MGFRTSKRNSTQATPFFLDYGPEEMVPIEVMGPSTRLALSSKPSDSYDCIYDMEALKAQEA